MTYDNMGGIVQKNQTASLNYPGYPGEKYNYYYTLGNTSHPHATSKVWDRRSWAGQMGEAADIARVLK